MNYKSLLRASVSSALLTVPGIVLAQGLGQITPFQGTAGGTLIEAVTAIVNFLLVLAGLAASVFLVIGGVQYITSRGDEDTAAKAKNTILYAVIGLVVIGLSAAIVNFVVSAVSTT